MKFLGEVSEGLFDKLKNVIFAFLIFTVWIYAITSFLNYLVDGQYGPPPMKYRFFMSVIWAAVWEEAVFRVAPITIANKIDPKLIFPVVIISSALFGWGHGAGPISLLIQGVMGFVLSCLYIKNGFSYWSVVLLHSSWNAACLFILPKLS